MKPEKPADVFKFWKSIQESYLKILNHLNDEDFDFKLTEDMHSLKNILNHVFKVYHWWLDANIQDGKNELTPKGKPQTVAEFKEKFIEAQKRLEEFMNAWQWEDWEDTRIITLGGQRLKVPLWWIFWRIAEHDIHHRAQIKLYLKALNKPIPEEEFWNIPKEFFLET